MSMYCVNLTIDIGLYNAVLFCDTANRGSYVASVIEEWVWSIGGWYWTRENWSTWGKTCSVGTLSTTNPTTDTGDWTCPSAV